MFTNFSMCPGGAMMFCESVGEYDENIPMPPVPEEKQIEITNSFLSRDPVITVINMLRPYYLKYIKPLSSLNYRPTETADVTQTAETISIATSCIGNGLRDAIAYCVAMMSIATRTYTDRYAGEKFYALAGTFIKNKARLRQLGFNSMEFQVSTMSAFNQSWSISRIIEILIGHPQILEQIIDGDTLRGLVDSDYDITMFDGLSDLLVAVFEDPERLARLESNESRTIYLESLINSMRKDDGPMDCDRADVNRTACLMRFISQIVRQNMRECYDVQCNVADGTFSGFVDFSKAILRLHNLFALCVIHVLVCAYYAREQVEFTKSASRFTDRMLEALKAD